MELIAWTSPELGIGGQMIDDASAAEGGADRTAVADVGADDIDPVEGEVVERRAGAVHDANALARDSPAAGRGASR